MVTHDTDVRYRKPVFLLRFGDCAEQERFRVLIFQDELLPVCAGNNMIGGAGYQESCTSHISIDGLRKRIASLEHTLILQMF